MVQQRMYCPVRSLVERYAALILWLAPEGRLSACAAGIGDLSDPDIETGKSPQSDSTEFQGRHVEGNHVALMQKGKHYCRRESCTIDVE